MYTSRSGCLPASSSCRDASAGRPIMTWPCTLLQAFVSIMLCLAPDELTPAAESALVHRLLEDGDDRNDGTASFLWATDGGYAVVLERLAGELSVILARCAREQGGAGCVGLPC